VNIRIRNQSFLIKESKTLVDFQLSRTDLTVNLNPSNYENNHNRNAVNNQHPQLNRQHVLDVVITYVDNEVLHNCDCIEHILHENIKLNDFIRISFPR